VIAVPGLDLVLTGGTVIDGTGAPRRRADVGVAGGRIVAIGDLSAAAGNERIDATDRVVAPGWIDLHSHSDLTLLSDGRAVSKVAQGVTTEVNGNCGMGGVPLPPSVADLTRVSNATIDPDATVRWEWTDLAGYVRALHDTGLAINTAPLIGHLAVRIAVAGEAARPLDNGEHDALVAAIEACLDDGAAGVSTGLMYPPAISADHDELVAIGRAVARRDRLFAIHMRNYSDHLLDAVTEALAIARASGCRLQISHLAVAGRRNWGAVPRALESIEAARADGVDVAVDIYPYIAGSANLSQLLPVWAQAGGPAAIVERLSSAEERRKIRDDWRESLFFGWDEIEVSSSEPGLEETLGLTVQAVAEAWSMDPNETALDLIARSDNRVQMVAYGRSEDDLRAVLTRDLTSIGSDGLAMDPDGRSSAGRPHPRSFGCYPRLLGRYVRDAGLLTLERAIEMSTSRPADRAGLTGRGRIVEGGVADLVVFDPDAIIDTATFAEPTLRPVGIEQVVVAGHRVLADGRLGLGSPDGRRSLPDRAVDAAHVAGGPGPARHARPQRPRQLVPAPGTDGQDGRQRPGAQRRPVHPRLRCRLARGRVPGLWLSVPADARADRADG
jgi:N-acyl-D-aspartate/D-glutamate deacylase